MMGTNWWDFAPQMPQHQTFHFGGWACPSCRRCYSPSVTECPHCQPVALVAEAPAENGYRMHVVGATPFSMGTLTTMCPRPKAGGMCGCEDSDD